MKRDLFGLAAPWFLESVRVWSLFSVFDSGNATIFCPLRYDFAVIEYFAFQNGDPRRGFGDVGKIDVSRFLNIVFFGNRKLNSCVLVHIWHSSRQFVSSGSNQQWQQSAVRVLQQ